jgi:hypothetical protein
MEGEKRFCKGLYLKMNWVGSSAYAQVGVISDALFVFSVLKNPDFASGGTKFAKIYVVSIVFFKKLQSCSP